MAERLANQDVTELLQAWQHGETGALERLLPRVYDELRRVARAYLRRERPGHTLQPTALVHEAYARLIAGRAPSARDRAHFLALAARLMREILVDHARRRAARKRGGAATAISLDDAIPAPEIAIVDLLALDEALIELNARDSRLCQVVELKFFAGLSIDEAASALQVSAATVERDWTVSRAWLHQRKWGTGMAVNDSHLRAICFYVANTSEERTDRPGWPRVTAAGFELPDRRSGFALLEPLDGKWELVEGEHVRLDGKTVSLDFAIVARMTQTPPTWSPRNPRGIPPGQAAARGSGTRFCVSGPFPDEAPPPGVEPPTEPITMRIEDILNGVVVGFEGVDGIPFGIDAGVWTDPSRLIPLYPKK